MARVGALIVALCAATMLLGRTAYAAPSMSVAPDSATPGTTVTVTPAFPALTTCQLEFDKTVAGAAAPCGFDGTGYSPIALVVPDDPGSHVITACSPDCADQKQVETAPITVLVATSPDSAVASQPSSDLTDSSPLSLQVTVPTSVSAGTIASQTVTPSLPGSQSAGGPTTQPAGSPPVSVAAAPASKSLPKVVTVGGSVALIVLLLLAILLLRRGPRHNGTPPPLVLVTTSARYRRVRLAPSRRAPRPGLGFVHRRSRIAAVRRSRPDPRGRP